METSKSDIEGDFIDFADFPTFYTPTPVWITLAKIPAQSKVAWSLLAEHANVGRQMGVTKITAPKMETVAKAIGTNRHKLRDYFKALVEIGAMQITEFRYMGGMRRGYRYKMRFNPPTGYTGPTSLAEYYRDLGDTQFEWVQHRNEAAESAVFAGQPGGYQTMSTGGHQTMSADGSRTDPADGDQTTPARRKARRSKPLVGGNPVPPPPPSSVGAGEDASPEAPLEEDEEMKGNDINPSPEARAHLPQEREGDDEESFASNSPEGLPGGLVDIPGWLATLPGLGDRETAFYGFLEYPVMQALAAGWTLQGLREHLKPLVNPDLARSKNAVPGWYEKHLSELPEAPKAVVPLCDNPAHALNPKEDPVRGGCFFCNTPAKVVTVVEPVPVTDADGDAVSLGLAFRANLRAKRIERTTEPSRNQMPHHRAADEAERNREKANDLLRGESGR